MADDNACARVQGVIDQLNAVQQEAWTNTPPPDANGAASFNYLYTKITEGILLKLRDGGFKDPEFLSELDVQFAHRYLDALRNYQKNPESSPRSWRVLFDRRANPHITEMQFAIAGVNAHINYDLAFALVATWKQTDPPDSTGPQHDDYQTINQVFHDEMANLRHHFEDPLLRKLDAATVERLSNHFDDMLVITFRNSAWHTGEHLWRLEDRSPREFGLKSRAMDAMASLAGQALLFPIDLDG